jgi:nicotinamidase-related amidase
VVCGKFTEFCVDTTTRRALALGYPVTLIADAHTSAGNAVLTPTQVIDHHNATLGDIASFGPRVALVPSAEVKFAG